ncbi:MAG: ABC transporter ATP-binding protein [Paracoccus sp. (in: a-proteobacteria)]
MHEPLFQITTASAGYGKSLIFHDLNLTIPKGCITALCGPNGSGKSTVLRSMRRLLPLSAGQAALNGRALGEWREKDLARALAMLAQSPDAPAEMNVHDLVMLGRFAHRHSLAGSSKTDQTACQQALAATGMTGLAMTPIGALSGGQKQRAWIAMVLAQEAPAILLDEPTNHLDISHTLDVLELVCDLNREGRRSFVVVLHDLNLVARFADHVVLFNHGQIAAEGPVREVLTESIISETFGIDCRILWPEGLGYPVIVPLSVRHTRHLSAAE